MNKRSLVIIGIIIFIVAIIFANYLLQKANEKILIQDDFNTTQADEQKKNTEITSVTNKNFESEVLKSNQTVLIDFYADWCGPCKILSPIVESFATENSDIKVVKINIDEQQEIALQYKIMSIPTLVVIKNGKETNRIVGVVDKSEIVAITK